MYSPHSDVCSLFCLPAPTPLEASRGTFGKRKRGECRSFMIIIKSKSKKNWSGVIFFTVIFWMGEGMVPLTQN